MVEVKIATTTMKPLLIRKFFFELRERISAGLSFSTLHVSNIFSESVDNTNTLSITFRRALNPFRPSKNCFGILSDNQR